MHGARSSSARGYMSAIDGSSSGSARGLTWDLTTSRRSFSYGPYSDVLSQVTEALVHIGQPTQAGARRFEVALPPLEEQACRSSRFLTTAAQDRCSDRQGQEVIETLREYRSALITDAVTGKIDVRGAA